MAGKRKNKNASRARRQAPRFFPPVSASDTPKKGEASENQGEAPENQGAASETQVEASTSQVEASESQVAMPPTEAAAAPSQLATGPAQVATAPARDAASLAAERERLNYKFKDNAWARALLTTQIRQTQRDIMRTKLLGTYEKRTGDLLSEFILKLHKRERELVQLEAEMKKLDLEEAMKKLDLQEGEKPEKARN